MNEFEVNDLSVGMDYLPADVSRLVNKNICNGGGGGSKQTTKSELDPEIKRALTPALRDASRRYKAGEFSRVADTSGVDAAYDQAAGLAQQTLDQGIDSSEQQALAKQTLDQGLGTQNLLDQLKAQEGASLAGQQGALGSARADRARAAAQQDKALQLSQADLAARQQAAQTLTGTRKDDLAARQQAAQGLGQAAVGKRGLEQETLDAGIKGAERFFGLLKSAPQETSQTTKGGGGK